MKPLGQIPRTDAADAGAASVASVATCATADAKAGATAEVVAKATADAARAASCTALSPPRTFHGGRYTIRVNGIVENARGERAGTATLCEDMPYPTATVAWAGGEETIEELDD